MNEIVTDFGITSDMPNACGTSKAKCGRRIDGLTNRRREGQSDPYAEIRSVTMCSGVVGLTRRIRHECLSLSRYICIKVM